MPVTMIQTVEQTAGLDRNTVQVEVEKMKIFMTPTETTHATTQENHPLTVHTQTLT